MSKKLCDARYQLNKFSDAGVHMYFVGVPDLPRFDVVWTGTEIGTGGEVEQGGPVVGGKKFDPPGPQANKYNVGQGRHGARRLRHRRRC